MKKITINKSELTIYKGLDPVFGATELDAIQPTELIQDHYTVITTCEHKNSLHFQTSY